MSSDLPVTVLGFQSRGRTGRVLARYGVNDDPTRWGYPLLGPDALIEVSAGFPVLQADVEYDAEGYAAIMGWIQVVRMHDHDRDEHTILIDKAPQLAGLDMPYMTFGFRPALFDAPSTVETRNLNWEASATLVMTPDCLMTRRVSPLCTFSWGYRLRDGHPTPTPLKPLDGSAWRADRHFLDEQHPSWTFEDKAR